MELRGIQGARRGTRSLEGYKEIGEKEGARRDTRN